MPKIISCYVCVFYMFTDVVMYNGEKKITGLYCLEIYVTAEVNINAAVNMLMLQMQFTLRELCFFQDIFLIQNLFDVLPHILERVFNLNFFMHVQYVGLL